MKNLLKTEWPQLALVTLSFAMVLGAMPFLPDHVAIHWNAQGQADGWGSPWMLLLMPGISLFTWGLFLAIPKFDPRLRKHSPEKQENMRHILRHMSLVLIGFFTYGTLLMLLPALGFAVDMTRGLFSGMCLLFIYLGHLMPKLPTNWFTGYRCPWTLEDDRIWRKTHRLGGRLFFYGGMIMLPIVLLTPGLVMVCVFCVWMAALTIIPFVYSWYLWKHLPAPQGDASPTI